MYREKLAMMKNTYRTIYGAIAGDIIGSMYEFRSVKSKDFELFPYGACFTDDTVMTLAIARWLMEDVTRSEYTLVDTMNLATVIRLLATVAFSAIGYVMIQPPITHGGMVPLCVLVR